MLRFNPEINTQYSRSLNSNSSLIINIIIIIIINIDYISFEEHAAMRDFPSVYRS